MNRLRMPLALITLIGALALVVPTSFARVKVTVEFDKTVDFKSKRTWAWDTPQPGKVMMARTQYDDPDAMRKVAEPIILDAMNTETARRGLKPASSAPDLVATYYLLLSTSMSAQTFGQFLPAVSGWGLPPFEGATQSLKMMNKGSLVIDLSMQGRVVWRGLAQSDIKFDADQKKRESLLREAVRDLLEKYPRS